MASYALVMLFDERLRSLVFQKKAIIFQSFTKTDTMKFPMLELSFSGLYLKRLVE